MATILVVDDEKSMREVLRVMLECMGGHEVLAACDGREALDVVSARKPDLIIMDLMMPELGGIECMAGLTRLGSEVPVIVLSGYLSIAHAQQAAQLGCAASFAKPFDIKDLMEAVSRLLDGTDTTGA